MHALIQQSIYDPKLITQAETDAQNLIRRIENLSLSSDTGKFLYAVTAIIFPLSWPIIYGTKLLACHQLEKVDRLPTLMQDVADALKRRAPETTRFEVTDDENNEQLEFIELISSPAAKDTPVKKKLVIQPKTLNGDRFPQIVIPDMDFEFFDAILTACLNGDIVEGSERLAKLQLDAEDPEPDLLVSPEDMHTQIDRDEDYDRPAP